jgi:hypothetical protein
LNARAKNSTFDRKWRSLQYDIIVRILNRQGKTFNRRVLRKELEIGSGTSAEIKKFIVNQEYKGASPLAKKWFWVISSLLAILLALIFVIFQTHSVNDPSDFINNICGDIKICQEIRLFFEGFR